MAPRQPCPRISVTCLWGPRYPPLKGGPGLRADPLPLTGGVCVKREVNFEQELPETTFELISKLL